MVACYQGLRKSKGQKPHLRDKMSPHFCEIAKGGERGVVTNHVRLDDGDPANPEI